MQYAPFYTRNGCQKSLINDLECIIYNNKIKEKL